MIIENKNVPQYSPKSRRTAAVIWENHIFYNHMEIIGFEDIAEYVSIGDINYDKHIISFWQAEFIIHIFRYTIDNTIN
jgi:hypothetical protein